jgi:signal transduction histidine kinase
VTAVATARRPARGPAGAHPGSRAATGVPRMIAMGTLTRTWRWGQAHPRLADAAVAAAVLLLTVLTIPGLSHGHGPGGPADLDDRGVGAGTGLLLALAALPLVLRRSRPLPVWAATVVIGVLAVLSSDGRLPLPLPVFIALYTVGRLLPISSTVLATAVTAVAYTVSMAVAMGSWLDDRGDLPALATVALSGAAAAVGVAVRSQRAALAAAQARAQQAELTREEEAVRRVTDERVRIARELHDVVAHHISVINVQAGVARHLMDADPAQARAALGLVREASKTVLSEMSAVVGLLRTQDEDAPTEPAPGLARVPALVESVRRAGLQLSWTSSGDTAPLPPIPDLTAYRVVQESLTNAVKYGTGSADLVIDHRPDAVVIDVRNPVDGTGPASPGGGHGLIGMRERVEAVSGVLVTGPAGDGTFTVHAEVPRGPA